MKSRYPEDSNIVDFIQYKLLRLAEEYAAAGQPGVADTIWEALDSYMTGEVDIIFKKGEPYVVVRDFNAYNDDEKNTQ